MQITKEQINELINKAWRQCNETAKDQGGYEKLTDEETNWVQVGVTYMRDKCIDLIEDIK